MNTKHIYSEELKNTVSFSKLQREAISIYNKLYPNSTGLKRIQSIKDENVTYLFDFSQPVNKNYISIQLNIENNITGVLELIKRVDFKYKRKGVQR